MRNARPRASRHCCSTTGGTASPRLPLVSDRGRASTWRLVVQGDTATLARGGRHTAAVGISDETQWSQLDARLLTMLSTSQGSLSPGDLLLRCGDVVPVG